MESGHSRLVRRLWVVLLLIPAAMTLLLAGCGSSGATISSLSNTVGALNDSRGIAIDSSHNVYIADAGNHLIREVLNSTGEVATYAGTGLPGYSGDGGPAVSAQLKFPQGAALDSSGNLYIADTGNNVIREITSSTGVITTIAGTGTAGYAGDNGVASSAQLNAPQAVTLDSAGNLYIADTGNNAIRKISGGIITTVAGGGSGCGTQTDSFGDGCAATSAKLNTAAGIALDGAGNLYIADQDDQVVREVSASSGIISTVAGSGTAGYTGDGHSATSAQLNGPQAVAVDSSGNIYIADTGNNVIRKVSGGVISTAIGNGVPGYSGDGHSPSDAELLAPNALAFDASGDLYIDDAGNKAIREVKF